jgi:hypothetical protein
MTRSISTFINSIAKNGGMSFSNGYDIEFDFSKANNRGEGVSADFELLGDHLNRVVENYNSADSLFKMLCDEAQLPNVQSATGQLQGRYLGENQVSYPYAKFYTDLTLGWMCDANMTPLKFLTAWHSFIFGSESMLGDDYSDKIKFAGANQKLNDLKTKKPRNLQRPVRLNYPTTYLADLRITKTEKGPQAPNARGSMMYILEDIYPYSIDAVPMSYGTSQITKVTANFYYTKHTVVYNDVRKWR